MGLLRKRNRDERFWLKAPLSTRDSQLLYDYAISAVARRTYKEVMSAGWALWDLVGIAQLQVTDFLSDGYTGWRGNASFTPELGREFLTDYFDRARQDAVSMDGGRMRDQNVFSLPPDEVTPVSTAYSAMCFAGTSLVDVTRSLGVEEVAEEVTRNVYRAVLSANVAFVPSATMSWVRSYAMSQGDAEPWSS
jgi:hypothetical protein